MNLKELQKNWNKFGKQDPLWAICTVKKRWELEEFFETGTTEIASVLDCVAALGITIQMKKALDVGCGVGRLTQALAKHFDEVIGVDIAPSMLKLANKYNRFGDRCKYCLNEANDLSIFADSSFDFIYTNMVLQHMQPSYAKAYIREFLRVLTPRSVAIFQVAGGKLPEPVKPEPIPSRVTASATTRGQTPKRLHKVVHAGPLVTMVSKCSIWGADHGDVCDHKRRN